MTTKFIVENAIRALLYEVSASPKPGLVDRTNNGAHKDMDFYSFVDSAIHLVAYFNQIESYLMESYKKQPTSNPSLHPAQEVFEGLVPIGIEAEASMLRATGGVNTHKGAIYALGLLSCASMECLIGGLPLERKWVLNRVSQYVAPSIETTFKENRGSKTYGQLQYETLGLLGARGEAYHAYPNVQNTALPMLEDALSKGCHFNDSMVHALLGLMSIVRDSNVIGRHDINKLLESQKKAREILEKGSVFSLEGNHAIRAYDTWCIENNVSHGGCADLLAVAVFLHFIN